MQNLSVPDETSKTHIAETSKWFCPQTGIYSSKHKAMQLPDNPFLDVVSFIFSHAHPGVLALVDSQSGSSISYTQLPKLVKSMASGLHQIGISQGQVVLILLPNTIYFPVIYLAVLSLGAVVTAMNPLSSQAEVQRQVNDCKAVLAFTIPACIEKLEKLGVQVVLVPEEIEANLGSSDFSIFNGFLLSDSHFELSPVISQQDTAALLYSSGTSGVSKGVVLTHGNLIAVVKLFVQFEASQYDKPSWENVYLATIPMFHVYGLSLFATGLLSMGPTIVVMRRFNEEEMVKAIDGYRVTHFPLVPPILTALTRVKGVEGYDLRCLEQVSCGAAPLSNETVEKFLERFPHVDFIQGYGMTETSAIGTRGFNTKGLTKCSSVGLLAPNMEAKVVDFNTGSCLPPGSGGELCLRGPGIMKEYLKNPDATLSTVDNDGWLRTGDIAHFDQDGYLYISDRLKEMIKYKGFQVAPAELEAVLMSHPEVFDVAVTAAENEESGEIPAAFVVRRPGSAISSSDVIDYVAQQVSPYKKVRKVVFVNSIPRSAAGKILRRELRCKGTSRM